MQNLEFSTRMKLGKYICILCFFSAIQLQGQLSVPQFSSLSVDPVTNEVVVKWQAPNTAENIVSHDISRKPYSSPDYFFVPTATVPMPTTVYRETLPNIQTQRQGYRIRSKSNLDTSPITDMHITMQLSAEYNQCNNTISVRWTTYRRFRIDENGQIDAMDLAAKQFNDAIEYEIWGHEGTAFNIASAQKLTDKSKNNSDIVLENLITDTKYHLYINALLPNGDTATSHLVSVATENVKFPSVFNIDSVISRMGMVDLHLNIDRTTEIDTFIIYRSDTRFPLQWYYSPNDIPNVYTDQTATIGQVYRYNIVGRLCGNDVLKSDTVSNILMYATPNNLEAEIRWTEFFNESHIPTYTLHRTLPSPTTLLPGDNLFYVDQSTHNYVCDGPQKFCYFMTANTGSSFARSEESCVSLSTVVSMPEAIDPMSNISSSNNCNCNTNCTNYRRLFGPIVDINESAYKFEMEIFDRSGTRLFSSKKDFNDSLDKEILYWDGKYKNQYVKPGVYVYFLKMNFLNGEPMTLRGTVTVVTN